MSNFVVDYISLDSIRSNIRSNSSMWYESVVGVKGAVDELVADTGIAGKGADSAKTYMSTIHSGLAASIVEIITAFSNNVNVYVSDYTSNVDTGAESIIKYSELSSIVSDLKVNLNNLEVANSEICSALNNVSDIFYASKPSFDSVYDNHNGTINFINKLIDKINGLESSHTNSDFTELDTMISAAQAFILELMSKGKDFKSDFSDKSLLSISSFAKFREAYSDLYQTNESNQEKYAEAEQQRQEHIEAVEAARLEREKVGKAIKFAVGVVGVVASVALTVATGGAAAPLALGALGAVTAMASKSTDILVDQWVNSGDFRNIEAGEFICEVGVAGSVGFITGWVGGNITKGLNKTTYISKGLGSTNLFKRAGAAGAVGAVENIFSGAVERTGTEVVDLVKDGDAFELDKVISVKEISKDALVGGITEATGESLDFATETLPTSRKNSKHFDNVFLNNDNTFVRTASSTFYGGVKGVTEGVEKRFIEGLYDNNGDVVKTLDNTFDGKEMVNDFLKDAVKSGAKSYVDTPVGDKLEGNDFKSSKVRDSLPKNAPDYKEWRENGGSIYRDSEGKFTYKNSKNQTLTFNEDGTANYDRVRKTGDMKGASDRKWRYNFTLNNKKYAPAK